MRDSVKGFLGRLRGPRPPAGPEATGTGPDTSLLARQTAGFDPAFYLARNADVVEAGVDPLTHYRSSGWREGRAPNSWFDPAAYCAAHPMLDVTAVDPFLHYLEHHAKGEAGINATLDRDARARMAFVRHLAGEEAQILVLNRPNAEALTLMRPVFDTAYYLEQNPEVAALGIDPLLHFAMIGWAEGRDPSPDFSLAGYLEANPGARNGEYNPLVHYLREGRARNAYAPDVEAHAVLEKFRTDPGLQAKLAAAVALDPMVALPDVPRRVTSQRRASTGLAEAATNLRAALTGQQYRYVILIPHVRMSGAARVAAMLATALAGLRGAENVLAVSTDSSEMEYAKWFPDTVARFNLSRPIHRLGEQSKSLCLIDMLRGVGCQTVINVNSRLMWETLRLYGRQMVQEFGVVTYLFTCDQTPDGARVGYPVQWLRDTLDAHRILLTDTRDLADDIAARQGFAQGAEAADGRAEVMAIYTPAPEPVDFVPDRTPSPTPRLLWAGRFDRQKRVDLLVEMARENPQYLFEVWGKAVLDSKGLEAYDLPANLIPMGTYSDLSEVLARGYAGFVYTAQWDGLPTVLLDMAQAELPIVAPAVGGISELIDDTTGWLIPDFEDVAGYSAALRSMLADPAEARARSERLRARLETQFTAQGYASALEEALERHGL